MFQISEEGRREPALRHYAMAIHLGWMTYNLLYNMENKNVRELVTSALDLITAGSASSILPGSTTKNAADAFRRRITKGSKPKHIHPSAKATEVADDGAAQCKCVDTALADSPKRPTTLERIQALDAEQIRAAERIAEREARLLASAKRASTLPVVRPGTPEWNEAVRAIRSGGGSNFRVPSATDAKNLLREARGNMNRYRRYTDNSYDKGFENHPNESHTRGAPHNDLPHLKWKDWHSPDRSGYGHIFFDKPN